MAQILVLYSNSDGLDQEHSESADTIKFSSFLTANYSLTDTDLGKLVSGIDNADIHIHDARYFQESEHVSTSAGVGDAAKPAILDAGGKWDESLLDISAIEALIDHGGLLGLADDDHTIYSLATGTRDYSGIVSYDAHPSFTGDLEIVDKKYVDDALLAVQTSDEWQDSVLTVQVDATLNPGASPTTGDRYIIEDAAALHANFGTINKDLAGATITLQDDDIVEFNGTEFRMAFRPTTGSFTSADDETSNLRYFTGSAWGTKDFEQTTASLGLTKVGFDIRLADANTGGVNIASGVVSVNVDDSTIEKGAGAGNPLNVKADGINDTHIDFGTGANQVSAQDIPIADAGNFFTTDFVEDALQQLAADVAQNGVNYTVGAGGVTIGDVVYVSANNTVLPYGTLTAVHRGIGLALTTEAAAASVKVLANDTVLVGVLTTATAGTPYYWSGSALVTAIPSGAGTHVWQAGVAKNATDLHVEVRHVKKNA